MSSPRTLVVAYYTYMVVFAVVITDMTLSEPTPGAVGIIVGDRSWNAGVSKLFFNGCAECISLCSISNVVCAQTIILSRLHTSQKERSNKISFVRKC